MSIHTISTYRPTWEHRGQRVAASDEDVLTLAVAAAQSLVEGHEVSRVVIVTSTPDVVEGFGFGVVARALGLDEDVPVELRIGGPAAVLDAVVQATSGSVVVGVDASSRAAASGAVLVADAGTPVRAAGRVAGSLPMRVREVGVLDETVYGDPRVERELALAPILQKLRGEGDFVVLGVAAKEAQRSGARPVRVPTTGAASVPFALAGLQGEALGSVRLVAVEAGASVAADVEVRGGHDEHRVEVVVEERPAVPASSRPTLKGDSAPIPFSMPAYARAFDAKVGMVAATCECGEVSFPPRQVCLACGNENRTECTPLPRTGSVYTAVKVHVPVPGVPSPYTLAIVALDGSPVRILAQVADQGDRELSIGESGRLLLRRVATREGFPDYGYAFQADLVTSPSREGATR